MKIPVSVIVLTKNEESNIARCLDSVSGFGETFVVDSSSTDRTVHLAEKMGARVINYIWNGKYPKKKQWCLENLPFLYDWVLYVDADEVVTSECKQEISHLLQKDPDCSGYFVSYDYSFMGKILRHGLRVHKLVLLERKLASFPEYDDLQVSNMWEVEGHYQPVLQGKVGRLNASMQHCDHDDLYSFFAKLNRYSDWEAYLRADHNIHHPDSARLAGRAFLQDVGGKLPFRWLVVFLYSYVVRMGFLDGIAGFYFALVLSIYYAMITMKSRELRLHCKAG